MESVLVGVASTALLEGVKFLYQQAGEVLSSWRARRRNAESSPPRILDAPSSVVVGQAQPHPDAPSPETLETLQELKDLVEPIKDGKIPVDDAAARAAIADLRELLEAALRAPITFAGEQPRQAKISNIEVVTRDVEGRVTGVRARLADVRHVRVETGDVKRGGEVTGVEQI